MRRSKFRTTCTVGNGLQPGLRRAAAVAALALIAAPAFAVTTNVSVSGVPPDQVQAVTLTLTVEGTTVQAVRDDDDPTGAAVWVVDTPQALPPGTRVDVAVQLANGQSALYATTVSRDGAIAIDAEAFYTQSTSQAPSVSESFSVHTAPGNVIKFIPDFTYPLPGIDIGTQFANSPELRGYLNSAVWGIRPRAQLDAGRAADAGDYNLANTWRVGAGFDYSGLRFRYAPNPRFSAVDQGLTYEQQVEEAMRAIRSDAASASVAQDSSAWCHYGSGVGHPLGFSSSLGDLLGGGPLNLEVDLSGNGQDGGAWTSLGDYLGSPGFDAGGAVFSGGADRLQGRLNQTLLDRCEDALQEGHDQDPLQGVADESGTFRPGRTWYRQGVRLDYDFGDSDWPDSGSGAGEADQAGDAARTTGTEASAADFDDERIVVTGARIPRPSVLDTAPLGTTQSTNLKAPAGWDVPEELRPYHLDKLELGQNDWITFNYRPSFSPELSKLIDSAGSAQNNACRDKAPGPFLDWSDPDVESKYRSGESGPEAFVLRLP